MYIIYSCFFQPNFKPILLKETDNVLSEIDDFADIMDDTDPGFELKYKTARALKIKALSTMKGI